MKSSRSNYFSSQYFTRNILSASLLILFVFVTVHPIIAQELVKPEKFEQLLPETINDSWNKSSFNSFTSQDEHWGGVSYLGSGNAIIQIGIRHYSADKWNQEKDEVTHDSKPKEVGEHTLYLG